MILRKRTFRFGTLLTSPLVLGGAKKILAEIEENTYRDSEARDPARCPL